MNLLRKLFHHRAIRVLWGFLIWCFCKERSNYLCDVFTFSVSETSLLFTSWCLDVAWLFIDRIRCSKEFIGIGSWLHNDVFHPTRQSIAGNPPNATAMLTHLHTSSISLTSKESLSRKAPQKHLWRLYCVFFNKGCSQLSILGAIFHSEVCDANKRMLIGRREDLDLQAFSGP